MQSKKKANKLTGSVKGATTFVSLDSILFAGGDVMTVCICRSRQDDVGILADRTFSDQLRANGLTEPETISICC